MTTQTGTRDSIRVKLDDASLWIHVRGRGRFFQARALQESVQHALVDGRFLVCMDLTDCISLDSTFIGTLVMLATEGVPRPPAVRLLNVGANVREQLAGLGVAPLFEFKTAAIPALPGAGCALQGGGCDHASPGPLGRTMLRAHETLADLSPDNAQKFKEVISLLREEAKEK